MVIDGSEAVVGRRRIDAMATFQPDGPSRGRWL